MLALAVLPYYLPTLRQAFIGIHAFKEFHSARSTRKWMKNPLEKKNINLNVNVE